MRAVARDVGMVSSAVYRFFPSREALLSQMIIESYQNLAEALEAAVAGLGGAEAWRAGTAAARAWALEVPHEFQLIYGTPIPNYQAPPNTVPAAAQVAAPFLRIVGEARPGERDADTQAGHFMVVPDGVGAGVIAAVVAELAQLIGFISLELAGHFVGVAADPQAFYAAVVARQVLTLDLG